MTRLDLPAVVDTTAADTLKQRLLQTLHSRSPCRLDGGAVDRIGTAGLQILWSAQLSFAARGLEFDLSPRSQALHQALVVAGLDGPEHFNFTRDSQ